MAEKPTTLPQWATDGGATLEPAAGVKGTGFVVGTRPPARWMNWILNTTYQWMQYLDAPVGTGSSAAITGTGGDSDGPGLKGIGGATNGVGIEGAGTGTGAGGYFYGATATGARGVIGYGSSGGTTGGDGGYFRGGTGSSTDGAGVVAVGQDNGIGIVATGVTGAAGTFDSANTLATVQVNNSGTGYGIRTESTGGGILGQADSSAAGVRGANSNTTTGSGVYGSGYHGVVGASTSSTGFPVGVYGSAGVGAGVYGTSGSGYGGHFNSDGNRACFADTYTGVGVYGNAKSTGYGVEGHAVDGIGVYGVSTNGPGGYFESANSHALIAIGDQFSPVKSTFYMNQQDADPSSSDVGSIYLHGSAGQMSIKTNHNVWARVQNKLYSMTSDIDTITNSGTFASTFTMPGSTLRVGSTIRIRASAYQYGGGITPAEVQGYIRVFLVSSVSGAVQVGQARVITVGAGTVFDTNFSVDVTVTCRTTGAGGTIGATGMGITSQQNSNRAEDTFLTGIQRAAINLSGNVTVRVDGFTGNGTTSLRLVELIVDATD